MHISKKKLSFCRSKQPQSRKNKTPSQYQSWKVYSPKDQLEMTFNLLSMLEQAYLEDLKVFHLIYGFAVITGKVMGNFDFNRLTTSLIIHTNIIDFRPPWNNKHYLLIICSLFSNSSINKLTDIESILHDFYWPFFF